MKWYREIATGAFLLILTCGSAQAVTFANFHSIGSDTNMDFTQSGMTGGVLSALAQVEFDFLLPGFSSNEFDATYKFTGTIPSGNPAFDAPGGLLIQGGVDGTFSFTYSGPTETVDGKTYIQNVSNLLSGTLEQGLITGQSGSSSASFVDSENAGGTLFFASDFLAFGANQDGNGLSIEMTSVLPKLFALPGESLSSFLSVAGGSFDTLAIPEPAGWALMMAGVAMVGSALRRRRVALHRGL